MSWNLFYIISLLFIYLIDTNGFPIRNYKDSESQPDLTADSVKMNTAAKPHSAYLMEQTILGVVAACIILFLLYKIFTELRKLKDAVMKDIEKGETSGSKGPFHGNKWSITFITETSNGIEEIVYIVPADQNKAEGATQIEVDSGKEKPNVNNEAELANTVPVKEPEKQDLNTEDTIKEKESQQVPMEGEEKPEDELVKEDKQSHHGECEKEEEQPTSDKVQKAEKEEEDCETETGAKKKKRKKKKRLFFLNYGKKRKKDRCNEKNGKCEACGQSIKEGK
ncbi:hypothetical protein XELAEV_18024262mg [Xenopus laevis]|uniref:Uncharacterized protein n=1 Tax=Xenopus laevis TaxID=8355 RepID=A0A974HKU7_XENLA|nr:hypothetical protein XELAEV_18024262mg [Xenopus laevis]